MYNPMKMVIAPLPALRQGLRSAWFGCDDRRVGTVEI